MCGVALHVTAVLDLSLHDMQTGSGFCIRLIRTSPLKSVQCLQGMVCLEPAVAGSGPITLQPGKTWRAKQTLLVRHF